MFADSISFFDCCLPPCVIGHMILNLSDTAILEVLFFYGFIIDFQTDKKAQSVLINSLIKDTEY